MTSSTSSSYMNENYLDYSEFQPINEVSNENISIIRKAKWIKYDNIRVALKDLGPNEFTQEIKQFCKVKGHLNQNINKILGTTKGPFDNNIVVLEYANEGNLREYLYDQFVTLNWRKKMEMALDITQGLMCLHSENIIHRNLHSRNILVNDGKLKIADLAYSTQLSEDMPMSKAPMVEYTDPKYLSDPLNCKLDFKSDIYSLSVLLWELSSGYPAYSKFQQSDQLKYDIINGLREESVGNTPIKYQRLYQKCWEQDPDQRLNISEVFEILNQSETEANIDDTVVEYDGDQEIIQKLKLNYGIFLYGYGMQHSKYAIYDDNCELEISLYDGQPLVYTNINDKPYDACINFPFAEITYNGNLSNAFLNYDDTDGKLNNFYGHFYSDKVLVGGQLFIKDFDTAQNQFLKTHINWAYNLAKCEENRSYDFIDLQIEPKVETWDGKEIKTTEKLINWMKKLYQENVIDVIAYINPLRVSDLKDSKANIQPLSGFRDFNEIIIKVSNYKDRLNLDEWAKDSIYVNIPGWINDFNLFQGLIINENFEMKIAKKVVIDLIKYPYLKSKNNNYNLKFKKLTNKLEEFLTSNNIFSIKKTNSPIFSSQFIMKNDKLNFDYFHFIINYEQYEILLPWNNLLLSKEFEKEFEEKFEKMSPFEGLLDLFDKYGHLFPQKVILGKSFRYISTKDALKFEEHPEISTIESLKSYLKNLEIPYLLTQKGEIKIEDLPNFIQENKYLEIIEYDNVITLYDMLQQKQQNQIDHLFDYKIIKVGLEDLNDDSTGIEYHMRISIDTLKDQNCEVFGSIIPNKPTLRKPAIKFRSSDFKEFTAIIKNLETDSEYYVLWMIIEKPSKLSVFSFNNQDFQIIRINESILLQPDKSYYEIKTPFQLSQGCMISINTYHPPINNEPIDLIEFFKWSYNSIIFHSNSILKALNMNENEVGIEDEDNFLIENLSIELRICILFSNSKKLKVDNKENEYSLDLIGNILTEENFIEYSLNIENDIMAVDDTNDAKINDLNIIVDDIIYFLFNERDFTFDENKRIKVIIENYITNRNINLLINWLLNNQSNPNNIFLLGYFYCFIIKTSEVYKKAFNLFYSAINDKYDITQYETANNLAKYYIGICYLNGIGIEKNNIKAFKYFEQLSENYTDRMVILGYCYINGIGTEINEEMAFEFYKKAANKENVYAQNKLGLFYKSGFGIEKDLYKAINWIEKSAKNNSIDGKNILNTLYIYSKHIQIDEKDLFLQAETKAKNENNMEAYYNLGKYYEYGIGINKDRNKAFNFYKKAAEKEYSEASFEVGNFYYNGIETAVDKQEAFKYYTKAAKEGHKIAQNNLGILYENGEGTEKDLEKAMNWYKESGKNGYGNGYYNLGLCYEFKENKFKKDENKKGEYKKDEKSAFDFYKKAAEYKHLDALFRLGYLYLEGIEIEINDKEAFKFYKEAAKKGYEIAQNKLGMLYENRKEKKMDLIKAFYWYKESANSEYNLAYFNTGRCYENGIGIELNKSKAFIFYKKAAKKKHVDAMFKVAEHYSKGIGIEVNNVKAFKWYLKSAKNGHIRAQNNIGYLYEKGKGTDKNLEKAFYWYQKVAENGYTEAQYNLGNLYEKGKGIEKNLEKALYWYQKAAENGHIRAQNNAGYLYEKGEGTEKNLEKALYWYQKAAENGYIEAQYNLSNLYEKGAGTENNLEKTFYWYQKAAENGYINAQYNLGNLYEKDEGIEKNLEKAFYWYKKAAENEHIKAQNNIGRLYEKGEGTEENLEKALYWYQKAAENGYTEAQYSVGNLYEKGKETEKNLEKALYWYQKAAEHEHIEAQYNLGNLYEKGVGTENNLEKTFYWYQKAAENGYIDAQYNLGNLYEKGKGIEKDLEKAFYWYKKAAENEHIKAQNNIGCLYEKGEGTEENLEKALYWYQKAAENGYIEAQYSVGNLYEKGEGTEENLEKALYWYQKAAENGHIRAQNNAGCLYEKGEGTEKNLEKALYWYQKAAENKYTEAQYNVGNLYEKGEGTEKNLEKALYWYQKAAKNGHAKAQKIINDVGVADNIILASNMLIEACSKLCDAYKIGKNHKEFSGIRTNVFNRAKLFHDKIVPFGMITVNCIKNFCKETIEDSFEAFKKSLPTVIKEAEINMKLCDYTVLFNQSILTEFKIIQDDITKLKYKLNYEVNTSMSNLTLNSETTSLIHEEKLKCSLETGEINFMEPLIDSIQNYVESLNTITGFFYVLFSDLTNLHDNLKKNFKKPAGQMYYKIIRKQAENIVDASVNYAAKVPNCKSNINCIPDECDQTNIDGWPLKVIKNANKWDDFVELVNEKSLIRIECGIYIKN